MLDIMLFRYFFIQDLKRCSTSKTSGWLLIPFLCVFSILPGLCICVYNLYDIYMYKRSNEYDYRYVNIYVHTYAKERIRETEKNHS